MHISPVDKFFAYRLLYCYQIDTSPLLYKNFTFTEKWIL